MMQSVQQSEGKRKRRKRTDDEGRTFTCKCGKSYLSYPALYTHIKTKHSDEPLSKISRSFENQDSSNQAINKPQRIQSQKQKQPPVRQKQKQKEKQKQLQDNYPLYGNSLPEVNNIEVLREFLFKYFPNLAISGLQSYKREMSIVQKKQLKQMKDYWANWKKKEDQNSIELTQVPIKFVLGKFILQLQNEVQNISFKKFIFMFIFAIKRALQKIKDQNYFKEHNASQLTLYFDQILRQHLLQDNNDFISNPTIAARTLYHLGRWLFVNKFTNLSLKYNF